MRTPEPDECIAGDEDHFAEETLRYRQLIDYCPDMICVHQSGRFVYVNPAGVKWLGGASHEQFIGREITEFVDPESIPSVLARVESLCNEGDVSVPAELIMLRLDGTPLYLESVSVRTVWDGKPAYQVVLRDRSAHKAAEETQRYRQLIDHCPDMICVHQSGRVVYVNPAGIRWLNGTSHEQFIGHPLTEFVDPKSIPPMLARIESLYKAGDASSPTEMILRRLDGTSLQVESVSVRTVWDGKPAYQVVLRDLSAQKSVEETLRYQAALVNHVSDAVISTTFSGLVKSWNPAAETIYRRSAAEALASQISEAVSAPLDPLAIVVDGGWAETTHYTSDGAVLAVRVSAAVTDKGFVLMVSDQTARRRAEQRYQTVVTSMDEGVVVLQGDGYVGSANPAALRILGVDDPDCIYKPSAGAALFPVYDSDGTVVNHDQMPVSVTLLTRTPQTDCILGFDRPSDGQRRWLSMNCRSLNPEDPQDSAVLITFTDATAQYLARKQLVRKASHDTLTGLPNRAQILALIDHHRGSAGADRLAALMFIDLDDFKPINDQLGHHAGDMALKVAAQRFKAALRSADAVGRLGGDEFVAAITGEISRVGLDKLAQRIHTALKEPVHLADARWPLGASIGIQIVKDDDTRDVEQILRDADTAMYTAKKQGKGTTRYFTDTLPTPSRHGNARGKP